MSDLLVMKSLGSRSLSIRLVVDVIAAAVVLAACGSADVPATSLSGVIREPAPQVDLVSLPSLSDPGSDVEFRAEPGAIQVVYFGFTNCPDVCPTTLVDLTVALRKMAPGDASKVDVLMVTVDPERDIDSLATYVTSFIDGAVAAGTLDTAHTEAAGEPFGATWEVRELDDGLVEVDHSPFLYAVDDAGRLVLTWQFGAASDDIANDLKILLDRYDA